MKRKAEARRPTSELKDGTIRRSMSFDKATWKAIRLMALEREVPATEIVRLAVAKYLKIHRRLPKP